MTIGHWNHRVVEMQNGEETILAICEVYYKDDKPWMHNEGARVFWGEGQSPLEYIEKMKKALDFPVLTAKDFPAGKDQS